jgi:hypothetical protein
VRELYEKMPTHVPGTVLTLAMVRTLAYRMFFSIVDTSPHWIGDELCPPGTLMFSAPLAILTLLLDDTRE